MNNIPIDASIPVLTEIIPTEAARPAAADNQPVQPPTASVQGGTAAPGLGVSLGAGLSANEWEMLERKLNERILLQLQGRIDFILEHRVRDSLADVLQTAVASLAVEIRDGLQHTLHEVIARAVTQEIAKLQSTKNNL